MKENDMPNFPGNVFIDIWRIMFKYKGLTSLAIIFSAMNKMSTEKEAYCRENSLLCICFQQDPYSCIDLTLIECLIPGTVLGMIKEKNRLIKISALIRLLLGRCQQ